jgi:WD domain, G-beta repeat.
MSKVIKLKDENQVTDPKLENTSSEKKLKFLKVLKNSEERKKYLKSNFNLYLQGHTSMILSLAVTSDNKYIVSGSDDKTIRIWNLFQKNTRTIFEGHLGSVNSVTVTSNNKHIVSGSSDCTIII